MESFFIEWHWLERLHPLGVNILAPFLSVHGVPLRLCDEIDSLLYIDLMSPVFSDVRRIKVEGKYSEEIFWVSVVLHLPFVEISLQRLPSSPFIRSVFVLATPSLVVASILAFHHWIVGSNARCSYSSRQQGRLRRVQ
jgi:hypothetical protein